MHKRHKTALTVALALVATLYSHPAAAAPGDRIPAFDLVDLYGNRHTASEYEGRILLLFFLGHN